MKKIVFLMMVGITLIGCATVPLTSDGKSIEGIWVREDGTKLTLSKGAWELVSMEMAVAGYGRAYKIRSDGRLDFIVDKITNLKSYQVQSQAERNIYPSPPGGAPTKPFQKEAITIFRNMHPDRIVNDEDDGIHGNIKCDFTIDGDTFIISKQYDFPTPPSGQWFHGIFSGTYTRQN